MERGSDFDNHMFLGHVHKFFPDRGFGFITNEFYGNIFFHINNILQNKDKGLKTNQIVLFKVKKTKKGHEAVNINQDYKFSIENLTYILFNCKRPQLFKDILKLLDADDIFQVGNSIKKFISIDTNEKANNLVTFISIIKTNTVISPTEKESLITKILDTLIKLSKPEIKVYLWLQNILKKPSYDLVFSSFLSSDVKTKSTIFQLVNNEDKTNLIKSFIEYTNNNNNRNEDLITLLKIVAYSYVTTRNYSDLILYEKYNSKYWKNYKNEILLKNALTLILQNADERLKFFLFHNDFIEDYEDKFVLDNFTFFNSEELEKVLSRNKYEINFKILLSNLDKILIESEIKQDLLINYYKILNKHLSNELFTEMDNIVFKRLAEDKYFLIWDKCGGLNIPIEYIRSNYMSFDNQQFSTVKLWIDNNKIDKYVIQNMLIENIQNLGIIKDRKGFYFMLHNLDLLENDLRVKALESQSINLPIIKLITWFLKLDNSFDFDSSIKYYSYFTAEDQVIFIKRLFGLVHLNKLDLNTDKLRSMISDEHHKDLLDFSTTVILKSVINFTTEGYFIKDNEIFEIAIKSLSDKNSKLTLANYFEKCPGRTEYFMSPYNGNIQKGSNSWVISFDYNPDLVSAVKQLPNRVYSSQSKNWSVPLNYETEIIEFAIKNKFYLNIPDSTSSKYQINRHLLRFRNSGSKPIGIIYCEGAKAKNNDTITGKEFWWCHNKPCFQNCQNIHEPSEYLKYTLFDLLNIINANVLNEDYFNYIGQINRYNRLLSRLYCNDCGYMLHPKSLSNFAYYRVTRFHCVNTICTNKYKEIYLHHCMNGSCDNIIDSRDTKQCPHGLWICLICGSCCSSEMFKRRYDNLKKTNSSISNNLLDMINNNKGHFEKEEYYCYKGHGIMNRISQNYYECKECGIGYDTPEYRKFKD